jgi:hypothetical protein
MLLLMYRLLLGKQVYKYIQARKLKPSVEKVHIIIFRGQQMLAQFTSQAKIPLARHVSIREIMPTHTIVILPDMSP